MPAQPSQPASGHWSVSKQANQRTVNVAPPPLRVAIARRVNSPCLAPASDYDCRGGSGNGPNPVLDVGVGAVSGFQERELTGRGVGGHALVAPAVVGLHQADLRAGMGPFSADQDP